MDDSEKFTNNIWLTIEYMNRIVPKHSHVKMQPWYRYFDLVRYVSLTPTYRSDVSLSGTPGTW